MDQKTLKRRLSYDPETGVFTWQRRPVASFKLKRLGKAWNTRFAGEVAGSFKPEGYIKISIHGCIHRAHRLAWLYVHGEWPNGQIDHINGNPADNRIENLRVAKTQLEQQQNQKIRSTNKSGFMGVSRHESTRKWRARIWSGGREIHLGLFDDVYEAGQAYIEAKAQLHTFNPEVRDYT